MAPAPSALETTALTAPLDRRNVSTFWRAFRAAHPEVRDRRGSGRVAVFTVGIVCGLVGLPLLVMGAVATIASGANDLANNLGLTLCGGMLAFAGGIFVWARTRTRRQSGDSRTHYRLARFAADNRMDYLPGPTLGTYLTPWADRATRLQVSHVLRTYSKRWIEFGNFEEHYARGDERGTGFGGYIALRLATPLPDILLRSREEATATDLWRPIPSHTQQLSLEGDFDRYFTLYAPTGYEADALYLFTPDVMANFIDKVSRLDVEILDDWVFLTSHHDLVTTDPAQWAMVMGAAAALTDKIDRWERWRDDRPGAVAGSVAPGGVQDDTTAQPALATPRTLAAHQAPEPRVAPGGRRLKLTFAKGSLLTTGLAVVVLIVFHLLPNGSSGGPGASASPSPAARIAATGATPSWANTASANGTKITSFTVGAVRIDVYQVATYPAPADVAGQLGGEPIHKGDTMVLMNYVATNIGPPINVNAQVGAFGVQPSYPGSPQHNLYNTAPPTACDTYGVNQYAVPPGEPRSATFATGDVVSAAGVFPYLPGQQVTFTGFVLPGDPDSGDQRGTGTGVLR